MSLGIVAGERLYCNFCQCFKPETDFSILGRAQALAEDENAACLECVDRSYRARLGRSEINAWVKEDRERLLKRTRNPEFEEMTGERRLGTVMHSNDFLRKLRKVIPNIEVRPGRIEGDLSLSRVFGDRLDFICWLPDGYMSEFSIVQFNKDKQPINEKRGWRTVLIRIIKFGLLTEQQAEKEFGRPTSPQEARFWDRQLYWLRNDRIETKD